VPWQNDPTVRGGSFIIGCALLLGAYAVKRVHDER
jgi:hypothetical protein